MSRHLSLRSGNPALTADTFKNVKIASDDIMTINGTVNKTIISLSLLLIAGYYTYINQLFVFHSNWFYWWFHSRTLITIFYKE